MDIVLLIISICFRASSSDHSYSALKVLSIVGGLICMFFAIFQYWVFWLDVALYALVWLLCATAPNRLES